MFHSTPARAPRPREGPGLLQLARDPRRREERRRIIAILLIVANSYNHDHHDNHDNHDNHDDNHDDNNDDNDNNCDNDSYGNSCTNNDYDHTGPAAARQGPETARGVTDGTGTLDPQLEPQTTSSDKCNVELDSIRDTSLLISEGLGSRVYDISRYIYIYIYIYI